MSTNKIPQTQPEKPTYWQVHLQLVNFLAFIGIVHKATDRLDLFKLKYQISKLKDHEDPTLLSDIDFMIDELVRMRTEGLEPHHEKGRYV